MYKICRYSVGQNILDTSYERIKHTCGTKRTHKTSNFLRKLARELSLSIVFKKLRHAVYSTDLPLRYMDMLSVANEIKRNHQDIKKCLPMKHKIGLHSTKKYMLSFRVLADIFSVYPQIFQEIIADQEHFAQIYLPSDTEWQDKMYYMLLEVQKNVNEALESGKSSKLDFESTEANTEYISGIHYIISSICDLSY
ncbi:hypothetical protein FF38_08477 [Lucilia cuprina]|uniref:Uncharacterized protein n=1 Tax=Lucilia cuprina TaxID=7375 RepID=A0A0L0C7U7_LUCCU|nr:hypothetical protein FF38_08477 [Lucilia cuprina]